uniref:Uncharacterized protein n=1 Tax=Oryza glumipatula TaxID=40148 RepID=A0A0E0B977_9ORYZ
MDGRHVILGLLIALVFVGNASFVIGECWETTSSSPICVGFMCKATCWIGAKATNGKVVEATCTGSVIKSECYCLQMYILIEMNGIEFHNGITSVRFVCKATCWIGAKATNGEIVEATCIGSVIKCEWYYRFL